MRNRKDHNALNFRPIAHQCPLTSNSKGDDSLQFCPNSHQRPNSPPSTIQLFMGEDGSKEKVRQRKFEKNA